MLAAQAAVTPSLKASFRPRISPHERQNQLPFREIAKRDCEKEFWPFLGPTFRATVLVGLTSVRSVAGRHRHVRRRAVQCHAVRWLARGFRPVQCRAVQSTRDGSGGEVGGG